jgi:hypothetical protein
MASTTYIYIYHVVLREVSSSGGSSMYPVS